jgi:N-methylhydantoinase B
MHFLTGWITRRGAATGAATALRVQSVSPVAKKLKTKGKQIIPAGEHLLMELPGGGGYGDPAKRDPALRQRDQDNDLE